MRPFSEKTNNQKHDVLTTLNSKIITGFFFTMIMIQILYWHWNTNDYFSELASNSNEGILKTNISRNIFIDGGANRGDTFFLLLHNDTFFPSNINRRDIDVYLFEASPIWDTLLNGLFSKYAQIKSVYNSTAIGTNSSEKLIFFMDPNNHEASSAFHKMYGRIQIEVDCIDICEWMIDEMEFKQNDFIIIKLDIEGGEYPIMKHIYENAQCLSLIDQMFVEWHPWGQAPVNKSDGKKHHYLDQGREWSQKFEAKGIKMHAWH